MLALAACAAALGVGAGASHEEARPAPEAAGSAKADAARPVTPAAAAVKLVAERHRHRPRRGGAAYYRRTARNRVTAKGAAGFLPLYREAAKQFSVNWRLLASIHAQETAFSKAPSTYRGLNPYGCCAGPMQFNVTNGPPSTWTTYRQAFRAGDRPDHYPHRTRKHPSIYDDFDAIMAAASLLSANGAGPGLDSLAWTAAYDYYGHDLFGITYASQILARAVGWQRSGFCPECALDEALVARYDDEYGAPIREQLLGEERRAKERKKARKRKKADHERRKRREAAAKKRARRSPPAERRRARRPAAKRRPVPRPPRRRRPAPADPSPPPTSTQPASPPPTTPAPPPPCPPIRKLLGC